jgi:hypothetical protein
MYGWFDNRGENHVALDGFPPQVNDTKNEVARTWGEASNKPTLSCSDFGATHVDFDNWQKFFYSSGNWSTIYTNQEDYPGTDHNGGVSCSGWSKTNINSTGDYSVSKSAP